MSNKRSCTECFSVKEHFEMFNDDVCIKCARGLGLVQRDVATQQARIDIERERIAQEQEEAFNKEREAKKMLAERERARRNLLPFITAVNPDYSPGWVHADICRRLEKFAQDVVDRKSPRLMITMPPRHGKSEIGSKTFPSWYLGRNPKHEIITCSYSGDLAEDFSRKCRDLIGTETFASIFPDCQLSKDTQSVKKWMTTMQGGFTAAGVGGPITGRGAHVGIIDDPVKNREEAESEVTRQKVKDWYSSAFYTRLAPGGGILIIQTRWHDDDLAGWLLNELEIARKEAIEAGVDLPDDVDDWDLVEYPAIATQDERFRLQGEALHEERFPLAALNKIKRNMIPRDWEALYQQRPTSDDGDYFTRGMFKFYKPGESPPISDMRIYAAGDLAISTKQTADFSVFVIVGIDRQQNIWVLDMQRGRWNSLGIIDKLFEIQLNWNPEIFGIETGQIELTLEPFIQKAEEERGVTLRYEKLRTRGQDKGTRARPIQGRMEQGKVIFPTVDSTPWMQDMFNEMLKFPLGKNDDIVDALAWIGQMIMLFSIVNQKKPKAAKSFRDVLYKYGGGRQRNRHKSGMAA